MLKILKLGFYAGVGGNIVASYIQGGVNVIKA